VCWIYVLCVFAKIIKYCIISKYNCNIGAAIRK
jgi:hypothetical protein